MIKSRLCIIVLLLVLQLKTAISQVTIQFLPSLHGQTIDGLAYAGIQNLTGNKLNAELVIRVNDGNGKSVVSIVVPSFLLNQGANTINRLAFSKSRFYFGTTAASKILNQTQRLPEGEYEFCYELTTTIDKSTQPGGYYESCFTHVVAPSSPLLLIDPIDGDELCNKRPTFTWQIPVPFRPENRYRLQLVKIEEGQQVIEAITNNVPVLQQMNLSSTVLLFPPNAPDLKEGNRYAWQVTVYTGETIITRSEIWTFKVACTVEQEKADGETYRQLKTVDDGGYFVTGPTLRFSFENYYQAGDLQYSIKNISDPANELRRLPDLKMQPGLNKFEIDLEKVRAIKKDQQYLLTVTSGDGRKYYVRFVYAE